MKYFYPAVISFDQKKSLYYVMIPDLAGCEASGKVLGSALDSVRAAMSEMLWSAEEQGTGVPCACRIENIRRTYRGCTICTLMADTSEYRRYRERKLSIRREKARAWSEEARKHRHAGVLQRVFGLR